ncbi:MAG: 1-acyl-sn-glycerol-3-phosphate acyltransferase [Treponema sp.]|nr:1-acyl-sn-glycerol-3-phosphate acyltransferase [Treponema sp.]
METLNSQFMNYIRQVISLSKSSTYITESNVYQEAAEDITPFLDKMVDELVLPGSGVDGMDNLVDLFEKAESGKSCLLFPEHYSNLDLSLIARLVAKEGGSGEAIAKSIVAIAGMKLNEESPVVSAFASAYTRLVIYPSRSLLGLDPVKNKQEIVRSNAINRAALKILMDIKVKGKLILVFPSGTRYRPWDPNSKKGVREIDSYIKSFDYMCPVAINGEVLHVRQGDMMEDSVSQDVVRITAGPVISCKEFRDKIRDKCASAESGASAGSGAGAKGSAGANGNTGTNGSAEDKKQAVADAIMAILEEMHISGEKNRQSLLKK